MTYHALIVSVMRVVPGRQRRRGRGFTLIELLVVISIIGLLIAILLPALQAARDAGRAAVCGSNTRQIATAMFMYANDHDGWLPPYNIGEGAGSSAFVMRGFYTNLLVDGGYLPDTGWAVGSWGTPDPNWGNIRTGVWRCPSANNFVSGGGYGINQSHLQNWKGYWGGDGSVRLADLKRPTKYWLIGDTEFVHSTKGEGATVLVTYCWRHNISRDSATYQPSPRHAGTTSVAMTDGHVARIDFQQLYDGGADAVLDEMFYEQEYR